MEYGDLLKLIHKTAEYYLIKKPYLVGGIPRDIYLKIPNVKTTDIDVTTNSPESLRLGVLIADKINEIFEVSDDGHITVFSSKYDIDFSSHFVSKKVSEYLGNKEPELREVYSRDFTINTLHQDLLTGEITDPTGMGFEDVKRKIIRTPVPPEITLTDDPRRVYRAINLATRYGFDVDEEIKDFVRSNLELFSSKNIKDKYAVVKLNKALIEDEDKTIKLLKEMGLFTKVPLSGRFKEILISKKYLAEYLAGGKK